VGDQDSEIAERRRALSEAEQTLGAQHPTTISAREELGYAYEDMRLPELALPLLEQVVRDLDGSVGPAHQRTVIARKNLANAYHMSLRISDAYALYKDVADRSAEVFGPLHLCTMLARSGAAACLLEMRRFDEAIAAYNLLLPLWTEGFAPDHRSFLLDRYRLATAWDGTGDTQEAMTRYWRLLSDCDEALGADDPLTGRLSGNLVPTPRPWHDAEPLDSRRLWLVSLSAIQMARGHGSALDTLYPSAWLNRHNAVAELEIDWGVSSRDSLLPKLDWLAAEGDRASLAAKLGHAPLSWDFARYSFTVRNGYAAEYLDAPEAWRLLERIADEVAGAYGSWREFAADYLAAREIWLDGADGAGGFPASQQQTTTATESLLDPSNPRSPWNRVPFR
jgi:tetratricopeptide (TPR) repeat protein